MLEVITVSSEVDNHEGKQQFVKEAIDIFREVLGTPPGRLRLVITELDKANTIEGLASGAEIS